MWYSKCTVSHYIYICSYTTQHPLKFQASADSSAKQLSSMFCKSTNQYIWMIHNFWLLICLIPFISLNTQELTILVSIVKNRWTVAYEIRGMKVCVIYKTVLTCALAMSRLAPCMTRVETAVWFWARIAQCNAVLPCSLSCVVVHAPNVKRRRVGSRLQWTRKKKDKILKYFKTSKEL